MTIYNDNIARPYTYLITFDNHEYYYGYRETNTVPAIMDIGVRYFTSSSVVKARGFHNSNIDILSEFEGPTAGNDAFDFEQQLIWQHFDDPLCLNENVRLPNGNKRFKSKKGRPGLFGKRNGMWGKRKETDSSARHISEKAKLRKPWNTGLSKTDPRAQLGKRSSRYDHTIYHWHHIDGYEEFLTRYDLERKYKLLQSGLSQVTSGVRKSHRGWFLIVSPLCNSNRCFLK